MCVVELCQRLNYRICLIIYWILHVMKKYWGCIKRCAENIYMYIRGALNFILKRIGKCGKMKTNDYSEMDRAEMDEFIDNMRLILGVLGHKILEPSIKRNSDKKENLYILQDRTGIKASGKPISEGFAVLKGSKIADNVATSLSKSVINKRQLLFDKGIVDENFTFTQDWAFTSPSLAAAIVAGYSINGRNAWKNRKGISLKEIEEG